MIFVSDNLPMWGKPTFRGVKLQLFSDELTNYDCKNKMRLIFCPVKFGNKYTLRGFSIATLAALAKFGYLCAQLFKYYLIKV